MCLYMCLYHVCTSVCMCVRQAGNHSLQDTGCMNPESVQTYDPLQLPPCHANPGVQKSRGKGAYVTAGTYNLDLLENESGNRSPAVPQMLWDSPGGT